MTDAPNPYEPVLSSGRADTLQQSRRSPLVTALCLVFALLAFGLAALVLLETISVLDRQGFDDATAMGFVVVGVLATFGSAWLAGAYFSFKRKRARAIWTFAITLSAFLFALLFLGV